MVEGVDESALERVAESLAATRHAAPASGILFSAAERSPLEPGTVTVERTNAGDQAVDRGPFPTTIPGAAADADADGDAAFAVSQEFAPIAHSDPLPDPGVKPEAVDHPAHYNANPSGVECIDVVEHMPFNIGNAVKYLWRCDEKGDPIENLEKCIWYAQREIALRRRAGAL